MESNTMPRKKHMQLRMKSTAQKTKAPVLFDSLFKRVNFALAKEGRKLRITRGHARATLGELYVTDSDGVVATNVDIEAFARQCGVLRQWESLVMK
jgi:hypothetical protein